MTDEAPVAFVPFDPNDALVLGSVGWDAWAEDYARLPATNPTYRFSKMLLYDVLDAELRGRPGLDVLDFNCGCGNDFAVFLEAGHRVVGCDGSGGMLAVAARRFAQQTSAGTLSLYKGRAEEISAGAFGGRRFDVILSATGGTAYLTDDQLRRVHVAFAGMLKPGGSMVITHLTPRCLAETIYHALRLRPRAALRRWRTVVQISVRSDPLTMYLRSARRLRGLLADIAPPERLVPLNVMTPPFQTGFRLPERLGPLMRRGEHWLQGFDVSLTVCDQVAWIARGSRGPSDATDGSDTRG